VSPLATDPYDSLIQSRSSTLRLVMVDGRIIFGDKAVQSAVPASPACEDLGVCGAPKFVCVAEAVTTDKLNQTLAQITTALQSALSGYDTSSPQPGGPFMPLAPLFECP
jgi:hypothetical protein